MPPQTIMLIRHAERPPEGGPPPNGVMPDGTEDDHALTVRGWTRAGALIHYFAAACGAIVTPDVIFAAAPDLTHKSAHGKRASQTVKPLAKFLGKDLRLECGVKQEEALGKAILDEAGAVLVCWEHHAIPKIVRALGLPDFARDYPDRFDVVWVLTLAHGTYTWSEQLQTLLAGDAA